VGRRLRFQPSLAAAPRHPWGPSERKEPIATRGVVRDAPAAAHDFSRVRVHAVQRQSDGPSWPVPSTAERELPLSDDGVVFDGSSISLKRDGVYVLYRAPAFSGRPGTNDYQKDAGPIPDETYFLSPHLERKPVTTWESFPACTVLRASDAGFRESRATRRGRALGLPRPCASLARTPTTVPERLALRRVAFGATSALPSRGTRRSRCPERAPSCAMASSFTAVAKTSRSRAGASRSGMTGSSTSCDDSSVAFRSSSRRSRPLLDRIPRARRARLTSGDRTRCRASKACKRSPLR
jgi:hypothetical protein